ncbi:hypothetical protein GALMADRAFT_259052 [Galerina marginata CBS 339.88]|uniref:Cytochrome P450 n=1 Tax=Galerina marginata (strain CBS 339.88) TaxID=685588 RepID=A0A067S9B5_GALM3|nr:hypothetical protein GALMADRAFT_259052 [Galerina marginata CBS 339.88]
MTGQFIFMLFFFTPNIDILKAGADTIVAAIHTFFAAMLCFPETQRDAQEELDRVLLGGRLPEFSDEGDLPYISALVKEVIRCVWSFPAIESYVFNVENPSV